MLSFSPDVKMIRAYYFFFFSVSKAFLKEYPVILILIIGSLNRRNEIVCIAHLLLYKIMIYPFLSTIWVTMLGIFWPGSGPAFLCGSGSGTLSHLESQKARNARQEI